MKSCQLWNFKLFLHIKAEFYCLYKAKIITILRLEIRVMANKNWKQFYEIICKMFHN